MPCEGKTDADVQAYFKNSFAIGRLKAENSVVWLGTSTGDKQTYARADQQLKNAGFSVFEVGFNGSKLPENIVYEINSKPSSLEFIKNTLSATQTSLPPPGIKIDKTKADLIVILGSN